MRKLRFEIRVIGPLKVDAVDARGRRRPVSLAGTEPQAMLAALALDDDVMGRDRVLALVKGEKDAPRSDQRTYDWLRRLRAQLGVTANDPVLDTSTLGMIWLRRDEGVWIDYDEFRQLRANGRHDDALELVRGDLVSNLPPTRFKEEKRQLLAEVNESRAAVGKRPVVSLSGPSPRGGGANVGESVAERFFSEGYVDNSQRFKLVMRDARSVYMLGFSHSRMVSNYKRDLIGLLARGGALRVLAMDPACDAVIDADARSSAPKRSQSAARHQYQAAIAEFVSIRDTTPGAGTFDLRLMDRMPPYTVYLFNEEDSDAELFVWLTPWRVPSTQRPGFRLSSESDERWFAFFAGQVRVMWDSFPQQVDVDSESGH